MFAVIFQVHPAEDKRTVYLELAKSLKPELENIDGFIDNERFESRLRPGWFLSLSTWRDEKSVIRWRTQAAHHLAQGKGRAEIFSDYHLRVGEITADTNPPISLRETRFDTTEAGRSPLCTMTELTPIDGSSLPNDDALLGHLGLTQSTPGLEAAEVFESIYNPGKILILGSWLQPGAALPDGPITGVSSARHRSVRIIRDYAMFDRRETPQYFPEVPRRT